MLDVRNQYEYDVGHFDGALRPQGIDQFSESDAASFGLDPNNETAKEETEVMMRPTPPLTLPLPLTLHSHPNPNPNPHPHPSALVRTGPSLIRP